MSWHKKALTMSWHSTANDYHSKGLGMSNLSDALFRKEPSESAREIYQSYLINKLQNTPPLY